jgi:hypothetical protein
MPHRGLRANPVFRTLGCTTMTSAHRRFRKVLADFDADGDEKLSREEAPIVTREQFDRYGSDRDGLITLEDAQRWD